MAKALEGLSIESAKDLQKVLRINTYTQQASAFQRLEAMLPVFESRMGAMLFLISALLSRGLVNFGTSCLLLFFQEYFSFFNQNPPKK